MSENQLRQNFHEECEDALNRQINMELNTSYYYLSLVRWISQFWCKTQFDNWSNNFFLRRFILIATTSPFLGFTSISSKPLMRSVSMPWNWWSSSTNEEEESYWTWLRSLILRLNWQRLRPWKWHSNWKRKWIRWKIDFIIFMSSINCRNDCKSIKKIVLKL